MSIIPAYADLTNGCKLIGIPMVATGTTFPNTTLNFGDGIFINNVMIDPTVGTAPTSAFDLTLQDDVTSVDVLSAGGANLPKSAATLLKPSDLGGDLLVAGDYVVAIGGNSIASAECTVWFNCWYRISRR